MKIGIIIGSIRQGRKGEAVAKWVLDQAQARGDAEYSIIDLMEFGVPLLDSPVVPGAANRQYESENVRRWGATIDTYDGFIFVTPEYNHSVPGAFKNAVDSIGPEWIGRACGLRVLRRLKRDPRRGALAPDRQQLPDDRRARAG